MLTNISWTDYIIAVAILLAVYYFFVGMRYFFADLKNLVSGKSNLKFMVGISYDTIGESIHPIEKNYSGESPAFETTTDDDFAEVEHLIERLKSVIADASGKNLFRRNSSNTYTWYSRNIPISKILHFALPSMNWSLRNAKNTVLLR